MVCGTGRSWPPPGTAILSSGPASGRHDGVSCPPRDVSGSCRPQPPADGSLPDGTDVDAFRAEEPLHALYAAGERLDERRVVGERLVLEPQTEDREGRGRAVQSSVEAGDQPVAPQDRQRVVAELALHRRRVHLPDVVEVEQRLRPLAGADRVERGQEGRFLDGRRRSRAPGSGHATAGDGSGGGRGTPAGGGARTRRNRPGWCPTPPPARHK